MREEVVPREAPCNPGRYQSRPAVCGRRACRNRRANDVPHWQQETRLAIRSSVVCADGNTACRHPLLVSAEDHAAALASRRRLVSTNSVYPFGCFAPSKTRSQAALKADPSNPVAIGL